MVKRLMLSNLEEKYNFQLDITLKIPLRDKLMELKPT